MGNELDQRIQNITKLLYINHNTHNQNVTMPVKQYMTPKQLSEPPAELRGYKRDQKSKKGAEIYHII